MKVLGGLHQPIDDIYRAQYKQTFAPNISGTRWGGRGLFLYSLRECVFLQRVLKET